jgi:hypothetical protein
MSDGRVVFDNVPEQFTEALVHDLYGIEANNTSQHISPALSSPKVSALNLQTSLV